MVITLENHHGIQPKIRNVTDDTTIEDLFRVIFRPDLVTITSAMTWNVITLDHTKTAYDAAIIMMKKGFGSVIITAYGRPFGIVTEKDLARISSFLDVSAKSLILSYLASRPLICAKPNQTIQEASDIMREYEISHLPILEKDRIIGIITKRDLAMYLLYT
jgi:signal-transduction protein with cAMP-binding, CBS, and nucleotidyltransferase domain